MRSGSEDKGICYGLGPATPEISNGNGALGFEFHKTGSNRTPNHHRSAMGKPTPSKWDDAQKWLSGVGLAHKGHYSKSSSTKPRNSNADDRRLIASASQREREAEEDDDNGDDGLLGPPEVETKKVDSEESSSIWRLNKKPPENIPATAIRSVCVRDMGTEMTPIGSQEPSRSATPVRNTTPVARSPVTSPVRSGESAPATETKKSQVSKSSREGNNNVAENNKMEKTTNALEARALAWDEAERAKYMARYKREEVKIQAWENHQKRKAEMEMKKMEVKAERMKSRAQEKMVNKMAATRRIAEEKRANVEAKLNEKAVKTSERADYIRRTGRLPSSLSFKLPSLCW